MKKFSYSGNEYKNGTREIYIFSETNSIPPLLITLRWEKKTVSNPKLALIHPTCETYEALSEMRTIIEMMGEGAIFDYKKMMGLLELCNNIKRRDE